MNGLDVKPGIALANIPNGGTADAVARADGWIGHIGIEQTLDLLDVGLGKFCHRSVLSPELRASIPTSLHAAALGDHVGGIVPRRSKEQMAWVCAGRVVAAMADENALCDGSDVDQPRRAMSSDERFAARPIEGDAPVSLLASIAGPFPAAIGLGDHPFKADLQRSHEATIS